MLIDDRPLITWYYARLSTWAESIRGVVDRRGRQNAVFATLMGPTKWFKAHWSKFLEGFDRFVVTYVPLRFLDLKIWQFLCWRTEFIPCCACAHGVIKGWEWAWDLPIDVSLPIACHIQGRHRWGWWCYNPTIRLKWIWQVVTILHSQQITIITIRVQIWAVLAVLCGYCLFKLQKWA